MCVDTCVNVVDKCQTFLGIDFTKLKAYCRKKENQWKMFGCSIKLTVILIIQLYFYDPFSTYVYFVILDSE